MRVVEICPRKASDGPWIANSTANSVWDLPKPGLDEAVIGRKDRRSTEPKVRLSGVPGFQANDPQPSHLVSNLLICEMFRSHWAPTLVVVSRFFLSLEDINRR